jgi:hypothetical protein
MKKLPTLLTKAGEQYGYRLQESGHYETEMPPERVGKIGSSYPKKKKFTHQQLLKLGYK